MASNRILNITPQNLTLQNKLSQELGISKILAQVLINREICSLNEAEKFLNTKPEYLLDPYSFSDMHKSVGLIRRARLNNEPVMIFGDYDVDGITSVAVLKNTLKKIGLKDLRHYLPHRVKEGYGLTKNIISEAQQKKIKLLITVDCGISSSDEIRELRGNGVEVIVTDHHEPQGDILPPASSILNPKIKNSSYKYRDLAGVGVAYKLCQALSNCAQLDDLDLVSLGTIADVVPLTGENRVIAKEGLLRLSRTKRPGLKAIMEKAGLKNKKFSPGMVSFIIAPRINASGRIDSPEASLDLLMSEDEEEAMHLAEVVETHNRKRQKIESKILQEAEDLINREVNFKEHKVIVVAKEAWHEGVLGVVASKLADRFYRPTIVISLNGDLCRGSARSIKNFHLFEALGECREFLYAFGGHAHAAGLVITKDKIEDFKRSINQLACRRLSLKDLFPNIEIDLELGLSELNIKIIRELEALEPFGQGNPEPLFYTKNLKLKGVPQILARETLKFWVSDGLVNYQVIGFGMSGFRDSLVKASSFDLVYTPKIDDWQDEEAVILEAKDIFFR